MMIRKTFIWVGVMVAGVLAGHAADLRSGAQFLKMGVGARELAMGSAAAALSNDVNAIYWNPAGLNHLSHSQLGVTHSEWLLDSRYDFIGFARPCAIGTLAIGGTYVSSKKQEGRGENRERTGDFGASDTAISVGYARMAGRRLGWGVNAKFFESRIGSDQANGFAADFGGQYSLGSAPRAVQLGLSVRNWGPSMRFLDQKDTLPLTTSVGVGFPIFTGLLLTGEWQMEPNDHIQRFIVGSEYNVVSGVALRGGFFSAPSSGSLDKENGHFFNNQGFVGGFGFHIYRYQLDYSFTPFGELGETHRFSLIASF